MRLWLSVFFTLVFLSFNALAQTKILAQVNDDIISERDLKNRLTFIRLTGQADTTRPEVRQQVLHQLIDEKLKQQEAKNAGIEISDAEVQNALKITLKQNGMEYNSVLKMLKENDLPISVIEDQIKSDMIFIRAVKKTAGLRAEISDRDVDAKLEEIEGNAAQKQYLVSEIVLPVSSPEQDAAVYGKAMELLMRLKEGEDFEKLAAEYSQAASAVKGGMVGWIPEDTLSDEEKEEFSVLYPGMVGTPVKTADGYKIYALHAIRDPEQIKQAQEIVHLIQLFIPDAFSQKQRTAVLRDLNMTKGSCEQFKIVSEQLGTSPRIDLGELSIEGLPSPIRSVINRTALLEPSQPLPIEGGALVLMTCSRETKSSLPDKEEIRMQLEGAKIDTLAHRRLRELRRAAVMEIRQ